MTEEEFVLLLLLQITYWVQNNNHVPIWLNITSPKGRERFIEVHVHPVH